MPRTMPSVIDRSRLNRQFPTQFHEAALWEQLGRTVAAFGFLEDVLVKAIFAFSGMREYRDEDVPQALHKWSRQLEAAVKGTLWPLAEAYGGQVKNHLSALPNVKDLVDDIKKASEVRNVICHGTWLPPDAEGGSRVHYVDKELRVFTTKIDVAWLNQTHTHVTDLIVAVINSVTAMGWQFPGSTGPGTSIWK